MHFVLRFRFLFVFFFEALRGMLLEMQVYGSTSAGFKVPLHRAFEKFSSWRKREKVQCSQKRFSVGGLIKDEYGYFLNAKGYNARILSEWLMDEVKDLNSRPLPAGLVPDGRAKVVEIALTLVLNSSSVQRSFSQLFCPGLQSTDTLS